jgi:hypothetical protein
LIQRILLSFILFFTSLHSEAGLRCEVVHSNIKYADILPFARQFDELNELSNGRLSKRSFAQLLTEDHSEESLIRKGYSLWQRRQVALFLKEVSESGNADIYELENLSRYMLDKLKFLADTEATRGMNPVEKAFDKQARHSALTLGLEHFIIGKRKVSPTVRKRLYRLIAFPFRHKWMRWMMIMASVPHMNGTVLPWDLAMKILWEGQAAHQAELEPYLATTLGKATWNGFAFIANRVMIATVLLAIPTFYYQRQEMKELAIQQGIARVTPEYEASKVMAAPGFYENIRDQLELKHVNEGFRAKYGHYPNKKELGVLKAALQALTTEEPIDSIKASLNSQLEAPQPTRQAHQQMRQHPQEQKPLPSIKALDPDDLRLEPPVLLPENFDLNPPELMNDETGPEGDAPMSTDESPCASWGPQNQSCVP